MIRYKILDNNQTILGLTTSDTIQYVEYNSHRVPQITRDPENAFGISINGNTYALRESDEYPLVKLKIIGKPEYDYLNPILKNKNEADKIPEAQYQKVTQPIDNSSINLLIEVKIESMKTECNKKITEGFDIILTDEKSYHFDLTLEDQLNLQNIQYQLSQGAEELPFHSRGDVFKFYNKEDLQNIISKANKHILYHTAYFNSLKQYINSLDTLSAVNDIIYGIAIPSKFKSDVLVQIEK